MDPDEIKALVKNNIIAQRFPELMGVEPAVESGPSESALRALRRSRREFTAEDVAKIPVEHKVIFQHSEGEGNPYHRTVVVVTDDEANEQFTIESK
jgi:hypothetical protein